MEKNTKTAIVGIHPDLSELCQQLLQFGLSIVKYSNCYYPGDPEDIQIVINSENFYLYFSGTLVKIDQQLDPILFFFQTTEDIVNEFQKILPKDWRIIKPDKALEKIHHLLLIGRKDQGPIYTLSYNHPSFGIFQESFYKISSEILDEFIDLEIHEVPIVSDNVWESFSVSLHNTSKEIINDYNDRILDNLTMDKSQFDEMIGQGIESLSEVLTYEIRELSNERIKFAVDKQLMFTKRANKFSYTKDLFHKIIPDYEKFMTQIGDLNQIYGTIDPSI